MTFQMLDIQTVKYAYSCRQTDTQTDRQTDRMKPKRLKNTDKRRQVDIKKNPIERGHINRQIDK